MIDGRFALPMLCAGLAAALICVAGTTRAGALVGNTTITTDGTLGPALTLPDVGTFVTIPASLGKRSGNNLFHSFSIFNIFNGDTAQFLGPADAANIQNVITRVTGGSGSTIDGTIDSSAMPTANFFLINPWGIIFGPGAALNVGGSFHATTADYLRFNDGKRFNARNPAAAPLSVEDPAAFGFLTSNPGMIAVHGSTLVANDKNTLSLVGGDLQIDEGALVGFSLSGAVNLFSAASPGEMGLDGTVTNPVLGRIVIDSSTINVPGGPLTIRGGTLVITNGSAVFSGPDPSRPVDPLIDIVAGAVTLDQSSEIFLENVTSPTSGSIVIRANSVDIVGGSQIVDAVFSGLVAGTTPVFSNIEIAAQSNIVISGPSTQIGSSTFGDVPAGNITLQAPSIVISSGASVLAQSSAGGSGGTVSLVGNQVSVTAGGAISTIASGAGNAGPISISVSSLLVGTGGSISAGSTGPGNAGNIIVEAGSTVVISGGAITTSTTQSTGGSIDIAAGSLLRLDGGTISTSVQGGAGNGGNITIDPPVVILQNGSVIAANAFGGNGGNIAIDATDLLESQDSSITASSSFGVSGSIAVNAPDSDTRQGLTVLPSTYLNAASQLRAACSARNAAGPISSLVGVGRGALPASPDGLLLAPYANPISPRAGAVLELALPKASEVGTHVQALNWLPAPLRSFECL